MTHDELLAICDNYSFKDSAEPVKALRAVVQLLKDFNSDWMLDGYQNSYLLLAIKEAIEKELA